MYYIYRLCGNYLLMFIVFIYSCSVLFISFSFCSLFLTLVEIGHVVSFIGASNFKNVFIFMANFVVCSKIFYSNH